MAKVIIILICLLPVLVWADSTAYYSPDSAWTQGGWVNPAYIKSSDNNKAVYVSTKQQLLYGAKYHVELPYCGSIDSIRVKIEGCGTSATAKCRRICIKPQDGSGSIQGAATTIQLKSCFAGDTTIITKFATDASSNAWTKAVVTSDTFRIAVYDNDAAADTLRIDYVALQVFYQTISSPDSLLISTYTSENDSGSECYGVNNPDSLDPIQLVDWTPKMSFVCMDTTYGAYQARIMIMLNNGSDTLHDSTYTLGDTVDTPTRFQFDYHG